MIPSSSLCLGRQQAIHGPAWRRPGRHRKLRFTRFSHLSLSAYQIASSRGPTRRSVGQSRSRLVQFFFLGFISVLLRFVDSLLRSTTVVWDAHFAVSQSPSRPRHPSAFLGPEAKNLEVGEHKLRCCLLGCLWSQSTEPERSKLCAESRIKLPEEKERMARKSIQYWLINMRGTFIIIFIFIVADTDDGRELNDDVALVLAIESGWLTEWQVSLRLPPWRLRRWLVLFVLQSTSTSHVSPLTLSRERTFGMDVPNCRIGPTIADLAFVGFLQDFYWLLIESVHFEVWSVSSISLKSEGTTKNISTPKPQKFQFREFLRVVWWCSPTYVFNPNLNPSHLNI